MYVPFWKERRHVINGYEPKLWVSEAFANGGTMWLFTNENQVFNWALRE